MEKIGILGCSGFIGSHLIDRLLECGKYEVIGIDIVSEKIEHILKHPLFTFDKISVYDSEKIGKWVGKCDTVISLAALCNPAQYNTIPLDVIDINFTKPLEVVYRCEAAGKRLIHFSTSEVYGKTIQGIVKDELKNPDNLSHYILSEDSTPLIMGSISAQRWSYASAKQLLERVIYAYGDEKNLKYTIIRPFNFIGPRMDYIPGIDGEGIPRVLACFMDALLFDKPLKLVDGGKNRRTFTAINDAIEAVIKIIEQPEAAKNQIFNIGNPDNEVNIAELADMMITLYKKLYPERRKNYEIIAVSSDKFYGKGYEDCDRRVPDISKAQKLLGWQPKIDLEAALKYTMISYVNYYGKQSAA